MSRSPNMSRVAQVHGDYGRYTSEQSEMDMGPPPRGEPMPLEKPGCNTPTLPEPKAETLREAHQGIYTKLVRDDIPSKITGFPKHVLKVQEVTKLLLFVGLAAGSIILLDISAKFLIVAASKNRK